MAGMTMHKTRKKEQRRAILEAARQLLVANGYEQFSMRRLACRIGCSPTAIYHYFKDKGDIVRCLCEEVFERYLTGLENLIRPQDDPVACLRRVFLYWVCFGVENPDHYRLVFFTCPSIYGSPEEFLSHESLARRCYFSLRRMVRDCVAAGCFRSVDPDLAAQAVWSAAHGVVSAAIFTGDFPLRPSEALAGTLIEGLLRGFLASED